MAAPTEIVVDVESLCYGRAGVARNDGKVVFIEGTAPGDRVRAELTHDHGTYAEARIREVLQPGDSRVDAPCPLIDSCGGCPWQHVAYDQQLVAKRQSLVDAFERIAGTSDVRVEPVIASPQTFGYRNRLKLRFHDGRLGFYSARSHSLVPIADCLVAEDRVRAAIGTVEAFVSKLTTRVLRVEIASRGELAGIVVAINSKGRLRRADGYRVREFLEHPDNPVRGVLMWGKGWQRAWGDTRRRVVVDDEGTTVESTDASFGQVNTPANRLLVEAVMRVGKPQPTDFVLDLYAGAGNLSTPLAMRCRRLLAVDSDASAVEAARRTAAHYAIKHASFRVARVEQFLAEYDGERPQLVVVNPPRSGLARAAEHVAARRAPRVLYVSCNPTTLARDLKVFAQCGYRVSLVAPVDMFPHTFHVESVCGLELT